MQLMLGYDEEKALEFIVGRLDKKANKDLLFELPALTGKLIHAHLEFLHVCGALDENGDTGDGDYDEDEAFEYLLDVVGENASDDRLNALGILIENFLFLQDQFMEQEGLIG